MVDVAREGQRWQTGYEEDCSMMDLAWGLDVAGIVYYATCC